MYLATSEFFGFILISMEAAQQGAAGPGAEERAAASTAARDAAAAAPVGFAKRKNRGNVRGTIRKRAADEADTGTGGGAEGSGGDDGGVMRKAAKQKDSSMAFTTKRADRAELFAFESSGTVQQRQSDATRTNDQETAHDRDARFVQFASSCASLRALGCVWLSNLWLAGWADALLFPASAHSLLAGRFGSKCWRR